MIRAVPLRPFFPQDLAFLRARLQGVEIVEPKAYTPEALAEAAERADALLGAVVPPGVLERAKALKLLQVPWATVANLDFPRLKALGVTVCNSHSNGEPVAEYAVGLLLAAMKAIPLHDARLRAGDWMRPPAPGFTPPRLLKGGVVGLLGHGAINAAVERMLAGFGVEFKIVDSKSGGLDEMLKAADAVVVAVPHTPRTRGMLNAGRLSLMKPSAALVVVSPAEVVDEEALFLALKSGKLAAAGLDTWREQPAAGKASPPSSKFPFHELPNAVLSPHRAGFAAGTLPHLIDAAENLNRLAAGRPLLNAVDLEAGY